MFPPCVSILWKAAAHKVEKKKPTNGTGKRKVSSVAQCHIPSSVQLPCRRKGRDGEWVPSQCSQKYLKKTNSMFLEKAEWHGYHFHFTDGHFHIFTLLTRVKKVGLYFTFLSAAKHSIKYEV